MTWIIGEIGDNIRANNKMHSPPSRNPPRDDERKRERRKKFNKNS